MHIALTVREKYASYKFYDGGPDFLVAKLPLVD
jgi:hypothetical protein